MTLLLDTSLWIDFTRARSPTALKQFIAPMESQFATLPTLPTPADLWQPLPSASTLAASSSQPIDNKLHWIDRAHEATSSVLL
jgi:hypothetical protein